MTYPLQAVRDGVQLLQTPYRDTVGTLRHKAHREEPERDTVTGPVSPFPVLWPLEGRWWAVMCTLA